MTTRDLPTFEATWWPVVLETVPGGEERLVVGVVVRAASGQSQVRQAILPATLNSMFASAGKGMQLIVGSTMISLQQQLDAGRRVEELEPPFGGIQLSLPRDCVAHDMNDVFDIAVRLTSGFGVSTFGSQEKVTRETQLAFDSWADRVREQLTLSHRRMELQAQFNVRVQLAPRKLSHIGFVRAGYVANFGVLRPGHGSADARALKLKVFDLGVYRRLNPMTVSTAEVIVGYPQLAGDSAFSPREIESLEASWKLISEEAVERHVHPVRCLSARDAAAHLSRVAVAT